MRYVTTDGLLAQAWDADPCLFERFDMHIMRSYSPAGVCASSVEEDPVIGGARFRRRCPTEKYGSKALRQQPSSAATRQSNGHDSREFLPDAA